MEEKNLRIIISGGGTGGHIFPAVSIANAIKRLRPETEILFVGAEGRMEMQRVPEAGFEIVGLPIAGFDRKNLLKNVSVLLKIIRSQYLSWKVIRRFHPDAAVGVGGYASGPLLKTAGMMGIPTLLQEQNSYAGVTNKLLAKKAEKICVAYEGMERFFPKEKIMLTGNPVRADLLSCSVSKEDATRKYGLDPDKKTILLVGGSLGARTLNQTLMAHLDIIREHSDVNFIWQTGKIYFEEILKVIEEYLGEKPDGFPSQKMPNLFVTEFLSDMKTAYKAADLVISRAGAGSISELCLLGKPVILVPSPNVAEDHQTKNALALATRDAAVLVRDASAQDMLLEEAYKLVESQERLEKLSENILKLALPDSDTIIAKEVIKICR